MPNWFTVERFKIDLNCVVYIERMLGNGDVKVHCPGVAPIELNKSEAKLLNDEMDRVVESPQSSTPSPMGRAMQQRVDATTPFVKRDFD